MWGRTRVFPQCVVSWVESFCRVVCSGLARQSRTGLRYLLTIALVPTGLTLVNVCLVKVFLSRSVGIAPSLPPPPQFLLETQESIAFLRSLYVVGYPEESIAFLRSLYVAGYPEESIPFLRLLVVPSSSSPLFWVGIGPMSVLSMLSPLFTERQW